MLFTTFNNEGILLANSLIFLAKDFEITIKIDGIWFLPKKELSDKELNQFCIHFKNKGYKTGLFKDSIKKGFYVSLKGLELFENGLPNLEIRNLFEMIKNFQTIKMTEKVTFEGIFIEKNNVLDRIFFEDNEGNLVDVGNYKSLLEFSFEKGKKYLIKCFGLEKQKKYSQMIFEITLLDS